MPGAEQIYMFRHALMRDAAYLMQPPAERARLHALLLEVTQRVLGDGDLALEPVARELADHARAARGARPTGHIDEAFVSRAELRFLELAQRKAMRDHNLSEAEALARRAADFAGATVVERARALTRLAHTLRVGLRYEPALDAARNAAGIAAGTEAEGAAWQECAAILSCMGRLDESEQAGNRALALARASGDQRLEAAALASQGSACRMAGRTEESRLLLERAVQIAAAIGAREVEGIARIHLGYLHGMSGRAAKAREHLAAALRLLEGTERTVNRVDALNYLFDQAFSQGQTAVARKYLEQAEAIVGGDGDES
ncbi:MAG: tetratricopeptide repeat protein [Planctomycetes bacterium]|nr:tetratricopeptide repeat protein [Planctomycetota bacterium]